MNFKHMISKPLGEWCISAVFQETLVFLHGPDDVEF